MKLPVSPLGGGFRVPVSPVPILGLSAEAYASYERGATIASWYPERVALAPGQHALAYPVQHVGRVLDGLVLECRTPAVEQDRRQFDDWHRLEDFVAYEPTGRVIWRESRLRNEVGKLYDAMSYMTWRYGVTFNTHLVLNFKLMGIEDHREAAALMPDFNAELDRWLAVGNDKPRKRWTKRARAQVPTKHLWLYVFEHGRVHGFHCHELCVVPREQIEAFRTHVRNWWERRACFSFADEAIQVEHRQRFGWRKVYEQQVHWFQYVTKSADRTLGYVNADGYWRSLDEIFKLPPYWPTNPVYSPRLAGVSRALSRRNQESDGFVSRFRAGRLDELYDGWEMFASRVRTFA